MPTGENRRLCRVWGKGYLLGIFAGELGFDPKAVWIGGEDTKCWIKRVLLYPKWITTRKETDWKQAGRMSIILHLKKHSYLEISSLEKDGWVKYFGVVKVRGN